MSREDPWFDPFRVEHLFGRCSVGWRPRLFTLFRFADEEQRARRAASN